MSTMKNTSHMPWPSVTKDTLNSRYEKCRHITEEIYKRINITFQIKSLETGSQSDVSDPSDQIEIDSNDLSNGTDLFAYEKSDTIPSSASDQDAKKTDKLINLNNNEIKKSVVPIYKPPRKRFRKKIKKRQSKGKTDSEGSSDEALPLSKIVVEPVTSVDYAEDSVESTDNVMGVPKIGILASLCSEKARDVVKESKQKPHLKTDDAQLINTKTLDLKPDLVKLTEKQQAIENAPTVVDNKVDITEKPAEMLEDIKIGVNNEVDKNCNEWKKCSMCNLTCRGERGLRRHMSLSHILIPEDIMRPKRKTDNWQEKTA